MPLQLAAILIAFALPVLCGFVLARKVPAMPGFRAGLWAMLPMLVAFGIYAAVLSRTVSGTSAYAGAALGVFGVVAATMGFGLGFFGHSLGRRK